MFDDILDKLLRIKQPSQAKSYLIGFERGQRWATEYADYIEAKEWGKMSANDFDDLVLPENEMNEYRLMNADTPLEWTDYLKGWLEGVREARR